MKIAMPPEDDRARPRGTCNKNLMKLGHVVQEISARTDRHTQTDRWRDHSTPRGPHPYRSGVISNLIPEGFRGRKGVLWKSARRTERVRRQSPSRGVEDFVLQKLEH